MRTLVCLALLVAASVVNAQTDSERRVEIVLLDGTRVEGRLVDFGQRVYRVRIGSQVLEFSEKEVAEVRFNSTDRRREEELALTEESLRRDPQDAAALTRRAELLADLARAEDARKAYEAALAEMATHGERTQADVRALRDQGRALLATGRIPEAIATLQRALDAARVGGQRSTADAAIEAQAAEDLARARAELAAAETRPAAARVARDGDRVMGIASSSPPIWALAPLAADGTIHLPWAGAIRARDADEATLRTAVEAAWRKRMPADMPIEGLMVSTEGLGAFCETPAPPYSTLQVGVTGHPDWATNLIQLGSSDAEYEVAGVGRIAVAKGATWGSVLRALHGAVHVRDPRATVWVRVLPHPWLSPVSMADLLQHVWETLAQEAAAAESVTSIELMQCTFSIDGEVRSLDIAARVEALLTRTGRLQAQIQDTRPVRTDKEGITTYRYRLSGSLRTDAGDVWGMEVARRRAELPQVPFRMGDYLDRLQAIAGTAGVTLGAVSGQPRAHGGVLQAEFNASQPVSAVTALTGLERSLGNIHAYNVSLRQTGGKPREEWRLSAECHAGFRSDPLAGVDPR